MTGRPLTAIHRYGAAALAPACVSIGHFILQFAVLRTVDAEAFGVLAFVLGFIQFGFGLSNALISTPYTIYINSSGASESGTRGYFLYNLVFAICWGCFCGLGAIWFGAKEGAWIFSLLGFFAMVRWFARSHLFAHHRSSAAAASDLIYTAVLLGALGIAWNVGLSLTAAVMMLLAASLAATVSVGRSFLVLQFLAAPGASLSGYKSVWLTQSRWTLLGVVSSETTSNAHSYAVAFVAGPAAFAPIAAATLLVKPIAMVLTSLTQLERPVLARDINAQDMPRAVRSVRAFRLAVILVWLGTIAAGAALMLWRPDLLFRRSYDDSTATIAFAWWAIISLLQCLATPGSVLLQAAQWFTDLAKAGVLSAVVAIVTVVFCVLLLRPVDTLFGIALGQAILTWRTNRLEASWRSSFVKHIAERVGRAPQPEGALQ